ncbi:MAG: SAM-dependent methyltransferase [Desulforhopalus sp.]|jgi:SAM-dependent methyltransferase
MLEQSKIMQCRDLFAMRAHYGWAHYISQQLSKRLPLLKPATERFDHTLGKYTDKKSVYFDQLHGTQTFTRQSCQVSNSIAIEDLCWGYGPTNPDFFREIIAAVPVNLSTYSFIDVGAGKGMALMLASEFGFNEMVGVELSPHLIESGKINIQRYNYSTKKTVKPSWIQADILDWPIPSKDSLFFFNNPLPGDIALQAIHRLEEAVANTESRLIIAYRKAPGKVDKFLKKSPHFYPMRLAPYWRIYGSEKTLR